MVAEQTLAAQRSADGVVDERALSLPTDWASERLHVAELALRPALGVQGQGLATGTAGERDAGVTRDVLVDGWECQIGRAHV